MRLVDFLDHSPACAAVDADSSFESNGNFYSKAGFYDLDNNLSLSYQEMVSASMHVADVLRAKGVKPQDVVATYAPNSVAAYCCIFAISRLGAIWLPLNVRNTLEANLKLVDSSDASLLFLEENIAEKFPELSEHFGEDNTIILSGQQVAGLPFSELSKAPERVVDQASVISDTVSLFATGGTTGDSKLAEWSGLTWKTMAEIQQELMPPPDIPSCYLVAAPMSHAAGLASFFTMLQGGSIFVMDGIVPERLLSAIETYRITHLFLPPTAIYMLLAHDDIKRYDYSSLRFFWYAAAPMSVDKLKEAMSVFGPVMVQTYGQVEAPMVCTYLSAQDHQMALDAANESILRSCGKVCPQVELVVLDDNGQVMPQGQEGEIAVKSNLLMKGYYHNPDATAEIRQDGWQRTGDMGVFDKEGYLSIVDRKRDMIISGGFNVYPSEIEQLIWGLPTVKDCAVIGIPDEKWGEQVTAIVELKDPADVPEAEDIIQYCKAKLGSVKAPKQVLFWDELPRSPVGKVLKKEIRKVFWGDQDRNI